jgi:hypothetical protein
MLIGPFVRRFLPESAARQGPWHLPAVCGDRRQLLTRARGARERPARPEREPFFNQGPKPKTALLSVVSTVPDGREAH